MRTVAVIQARLGSTRLPCKALLCLRGLPLVDWVVRRTALSELLDQVVVAIPDTRPNDVLARHLESSGTAVFRGPEQDVLGRMAGAARLANAEAVVRVCADNPLIWGGEIDNLIRFYNACSCDYAYNHIPRHNLYPDGLGAEIVSAPLLQELADTVKEPAHREHCLSHITDNPQRYRIATFDPPDPAIRRPELKLDVDTAEDFIRLALLDIRPDIGPGEIVRLFPQDRNEPGFRPNP